MPFVLADGFVSLSRQRERGLQAGKLARGWIVPGEPVDPTVADLKDLRTHGSLIA
jgi:hypothetical protein